MQMAMQTMVPTVIAAIIPGIPVFPAAEKTRHVTRRVAIVIPETGLEEEPTIPTIREATVTKKKEKSTTMAAPRRFRLLWG